jgi:hypothetical protein
MDVTWLGRRGNIRRHVDGKVLSDLAGLSSFHRPTALGHNGGGMEGRRGVDVLSISVVIVCA